MLERNPTADYLSHLVLRKAQRYDCPVNKQALLDLIAQQQQVAFADVAGTEGQGAFRVTDRLLNQVIATELQRARVLREVEVHALDSDRLRVRLVLAKPSFLPPLNVSVTIE